MLTHCVLHRTHENVFSKNISYPFRDLRETLICFHVFYLQWFLVAMVFIVLRCFHCLAMISLSCDGFIVLRWFHCLAMVPLSCDGSIVLRCFHVFDLRVTLRYPLISHFGSFRIRNGSASIENIFYREHIYPFRIRNGTAKLYRKRRPPGGSAPLPRLRCRTRAMKMVPVKLTPVTYRYTRYRAFRLARSKMNTWHARLYLLH